MAQQRGTQATTLACAWAGQSGWHEPMRLADSHVGLFARPDRITMRQFDLMRQKAMLVMWPWLWQGNHGPGVMAMGNDGSGAPMGNGQS